jgi:hypothetical protein
MGAARQVQQQIEQYLPRLNAEQQKAVLTVVKTFVKQQESEYDSPLEDSDFFKKIAKRVAELENSTVKGVSWEDVKRRARKKVKSEK